MNPSEQTSKKTAAAIEAMTEKINGIKDTNQDTIALMESILANSSWSQHLEIHRALLQIIEMSNKINQLASLANDTVKLAQLKLDNMIKA